MTFPGLGIAPLGVPDLGRCPAQGQRALIGNLGNL
jgi:hypothetical protein